MEPNLRVLLVEDNPLDAELAQAAMAQGGLEVHLQRVETAEEFQSALGRDEFDLILSDYRLPSFDGLAALQLARELSPHLPFIFISGTMGEEVAVDVLQRGATDYVLKNRLTRLPAVIRRALKEAADRRRLREMQAVLEESLLQSQTIVVTVPDAIIVTNHRLEVESLNPSAERLFGYRNAELIGQPLGLILPECGLESSTVLAVEAGEDSRTALGPNHEGRGRRKSGGLFPLDVSYSEMSVARKRKIVIVARDISAQKAAEQRIQNQVQRLSALRQIDLAISASLDLRLTLNLLLDQMLGLLRVDAAAILLSSPSTQRLGFTAGKGFRSDEIRTATVRLGTGYAGLAAHHRQRYFVPDLAAADPPFIRASILAREGFVSYVVTPLVAKGQTLGVLEVFQRTPLAPTDDWYEFLDAMAGQAAIAIDNATLFTDLQRANQALTLAYDATLEGWARALDMRDSATEGHTRRVTEATMRLAEAMRVPEAERVHIRRGALLHDIGKIAIPDAILHKAGPLTEDEWQVMRQHPAKAYEMLLPISFLQPALDIPYCHHEKWDGSGYPRGLRERAIPLPARLFAVVDVWDALRSDRPYRPRWPAPRVRDHLHGLGGTHFDPAVLAAFEALDLAELEASREPQC